MTLTVDVWVAVLLPTGPEGQNTNPQFFSETTTVASQNSMQRSQVHKEGAGGGGLEGCLKCP